MKRNFILLVVSLALVITSISFTYGASDDLGTSVEVPNVAPILILNISNYSWQSNQNLTNAFLLDDHFFDANGDDLTYYTDFSLPFPLTVNIDPVNSSVSFYPDPGFSGTLNLTFIASDGVYNVSSNVVFLFVGIDNESPTWHNPAKSSNEVEQNDFVSFWTTWRDNLGLASFIFSIEQSGVWQNFSGTLSGLEDLANYTVQISAPPGGLVRWRFYGFDTSGNVNVTDIFQFNVEIDPVEGGGGGSGGGGSGGGGSGGGGGLTGLLTALPGLITSILEQVGVDVRSDYDIFVEPESIEAELLQGEERSYVVTITNIGLQPITLGLEIFNIGSFTSVNPTTLSLDPDQSREVVIDMSVPKTFSPGQYIGSLTVNGFNVSRNVPIIATIKHFDPFVDFTLTVPESSQLVRPGRNVTVNLNISQIDYVKDLDAILYLSVKDFSGTVFETLEKEIQIPEETFFSESLQIFDDTPEGPYLAYGRVEFEEKFAVDSDSFDVGYRFKLASFLRYSGTIILILILSLVFIFLILRYERSKRKERLLQLYLLLSQLKDKLKSNNLSAAAEIYIKIKHVYGEPVPKEVLSDREFLKSELKRLSAAIQNSPIIKEVAEDEGKNNKKDSKESGDDTSEKNTDDSQGKEEKKESSDSTNTKPETSPQSKNGETSNQEKSEKSLDKTSDKSTTHQTKNSETKPKESNPANSDVTTSSETKDIKKESVQTKEGDNASKT